MRSLIFYVTESICEAAFRFVLGVDTLHAELVLGKFVDMGVDLGVTVDGLVEETSKCCLASF